jgi:deoxyribodipyrimidine photo-lyase
MAVTSVMWFRRDLRLSDNPALAAAARHAGRGGGVVGLFCLDDTLRRPAGDARLAFLYGCLRALDTAIGGRLVVRHGRPEDVVPGLAREAGADAVFAAEDFGPYGRVRDAGVEQALRAHDVMFERVGSPYAVPPGELVTTAGTPYAVFTPFARAWLAHGWPGPSAAPRSIAWVPVEPGRGDGIPPGPHADAEVPEPGEGPAKRAARRFVRTRLDGYADARDRPGDDATSRLSPYLKWGCIHPRQLLSQLGRSPGHEAFRTELCWREFYADVLWHRPDTARRAFRPAMGAMEVDGGSATAAFARWAEGRTGYPIVDAGMRQLLREGWMHNRVRMIVASFLVKDLHLDWRSGARWFMQHLVDGDLASNQHNWQWVAGTGSDAAPYFRVFNPTSQGERFDPAGEYVRRYVPELQGVEGKAVHRPWDLPAGPPAGYPERIVDPAAERDEALRRYRALR